MQARRRAQPSGTNWPRGLTILHAPRGGGRAEAAERGSGRIFRPAATEGGKYPFPFRTRKSSPRSPVILGASPGKQAAAGLPFYGARPIHGAGRKPSFLLGGPPLAAPLFVFWAHMGADLNDPAPSGGHDSLIFSSNFVHHLHCNNRLICLLVCHLF